MTTASSPSGRSGLALRSNRMRNSAWVGAAKCAPVLVVAIAALRWIIGASPAAAVTSSRVLGSTGALGALTRAAVVTGQSSARVGIELVPRQVFGKGQPTIKGSGGFNLATGQGHIQLRETTGIESIEFVTKALYVREPPSTRGQSLPAGKTWISAGLTESPAPGSSIPLFVDQVESVNAGFVLDEVMWGAVGAKLVGAGSPTGSGAAQYSVTVDLRRAAANATGAIAPAFSQAVGYQISSLSQGSGGQATMNVRAWVSDSGRVVKLLSSPPGSGVGSIGVTFSGFGSTVRVTAPQTSACVDIAALTAGGEQENGLGDVA